MPRVGGVFLWISGTFNLRLIFNTLYDTHLLFGNMFFYIIYHISLCRYIAISLYHWVGCNRGGMVV